MSFDGSMRIEGKVEGKIVSKGKVSFGQGASIVAEVAVGEAKIEGTFKGNLSAANRIELASTAHVMGDVRSTKLVIAEGATFVGNCHVTPDALKQSSEFVTPVAATPIKK
jgi:cytoskeletal protein CcmA (bactofilin family)